MHDRPQGEVVERLGARTEFGSPRVLWVAERRGHWLGVVAPEIGNGRLGWLRFDRERLRFGTTRLALHVDLSERLVELRRGGRPLQRVVVRLVGAGRRRCLDGLPACLQPRHAAADPPRPPGNPSFRARLVDR